MGKRRRFCCALPAVLALLAACGGGEEDAPGPDPDPPQPPSAATALPMLSINTGGVVIPPPDSDYIAATLTLRDAAGLVVLNAVPVEIRGRGNSTWNYPKKPYRLRLEDGASLLGMSSNRHWALLANYLDKTLLRNELAFEFSRLAGVEYTPRSVQVVVELNGNYDGIYQLTEHVRIDPARIAIPELEEEDGLDPLAVTGGYLMEVDAREGEDYCRRTAQGVPLCFNNPEDLLEPEWAAHKLYIDTYIDAAEAALYGPLFADPLLGYAAYFDVDAAIDFYLVHELAKNPDSNFFSSVFLYKKRGGLLTFGPVWDFDLAFGNAQWGGITTWFDGSDPAGWHTRLANRRDLQGQPLPNWFTRLFEDPAFELKVKQRWQALRANGSVDDLLDYLDGRETWLSQVQLANFQRWNILNMTLQPDLSPVTGPWATHVGAMRTWLQARVAWMDSQLLP